ncbi:calcium-binding protein [Pseudomonas sp. Cab53]|uniref:M10 family metallopeptidase C-terminal domain-containing protein n=1 Tax=Pseudomonas sp. Cab53 TaxID=2678258 RepID=UPI001BB3C29D|nr:M10 family metallopeptidase C-terminal domain-containing protein [Pseudomonas sp. Cab53]BBP65025.1 calcium-binding protein [Pseudomonas sp. Cab53]
MTQAFNISDLTKHSVPDDLQVTSASSRVSKNPIELIVQGTPGSDYLRGGLANELLMGGAGNDQIVSGGGNDVMVPGAGFDTLYGGAGSDVFRFDRLGDSYIKAGSEFTDAISYFDPAHDVLDLSALGFSHLGNGYGDTLHIRSEPLRGIYILENYEQDHNGRHFAVQFLSNSGLITDANLQPLINGTSHDDLLVGTDAGESIKAGAGRDTIEAGAGNDRLFGGAGGDTLSGGAGADTFVYNQLSDSYRNDASGNYSRRDLITDFNGNDHDMIDVSALAFTGLGNGYNGTLKVVLNLAGDTTALKSLEADANGNRFEILLSGNHVSELNASSVLFAPPSNATTVTTPQPITPVNLAGDDKANTLYGYWGDDTLAAGAGNDTLEGNAGNDVLTGGLGADKLTGGTGNDRFVFTSSGDSYAGSSDLITDFIWGEDKLDVSALGVTGLGDGRNGTLRMTYDEINERTYLRSSEPGADGHAFQVTLAGFDYTHLITNADLVVADTTEIGLIGHATVDYLS